MRKQWVLVGILAGSLIAAPAFAQHKAPNQQPATDAAPTAPTGDLVLGTVTLAKATTADGKPLPAGTYQVKLTAQEAKPDAKGASENIERWVEFVQKGTVKGREVVSIVPQNEVKNVVKDSAAAAKRRAEGADAEGQRLHAGVVQQGRESLSDLLPDGRLKVKS